jgi:hypothetical protein
MTEENNQVFAITQVNIRFIPEEDRLLFSMNTTDKQQFRFYFTRRWVKLFWPNLTKILEAEMPDASFDTPSKEAAVAFQHEVAMSDAEYDKPFETENVTYPWGDEPLVATEVRFKEPPMELPSIGIYAANGIGLEFNCGHKILHYFYQVLPEATERAGWDMVLARAEYVTSIPVDSSKLN